MGSVGIAFASRFTPAQQRWSLGEMNSFSLRGILTEDHFSVALMRRYKKPDLVGFFEWWTEGESNPEN